MNRRQGRGPDAGATGLSDTTTTHLTPPTRTVFWRPCRPSPKPRDSLRSSPRFRRSSESVPLRRRSLASLGPSGGGLRPPGPPPSLTLGRGKAASRGCGGSVRSVGSLVRGRGRSVLSLLEDAHVLALHGDGDGHHGLDELHGDLLLGVIHAGDLCLLAAEGA